MLDLLILNPDAKLISFKFLAMTQASFVPNSTQSKHNMDAEECPTYKLSPSVMYVLRVFTHGLSSHQ